MDAYAAMGVEFGSSLADVTAAFRYKAKQLHPDSNNGDRSAEPELRRMLEAYQFLKSIAEQRQGEPGLTEALRVAEVLAAIERTWETGSWQEVTSIGS